MISFLNLPSQQPPTLASSRLSWGESSPNCKVSYPVYWLHFIPTALSPSPFYSVVVIFILALQKITFVILIMMILTITFHYNALQLQLQSPASVQPSPSPFGNLCLQSSTRSLGSAPTTLMTMMIIIFTSSSSHPKL